MPPPPHHATTYIGREDISFLRTCGVRCRLKRLTCTGTCLMVMISTHLGLSTLRSSRCREIRNPHQSLHNALMMSNSRHALLEGRDPILIPRHTLTAPSEQIVARFLSEYRIAFCLVSDRCKSEPSAGYHTDTTDGAQLAAVPRPCEKVHIRPGQGAGFRAISQSSAGEPEGVRFQGNFDEEECRSRAHTQEKSTV